MRNWNRPPIIAVLFAVLSLAVLAGCTSREPSTMAPGGAQFSEAAAPYTLAFISRVYDSESNQTTFNYQLQNTTSPGTPATGVLAVFTDIFVQVPACAGDPVSMSPPDGASLGTVAAGYGVTWGTGYDLNPDFNYAMTFAGDIPAGTVKAEVTRGGTHYVQSVTGPCEGSFEVSGYVFTDGDQDGIHGTNDLGIANVTVNLTGGESTLSAKTDSDGHYVILAPSGTYTVSVDSLTADATDYNESLYQNWDPTNATSHSVTVGPNSTANDFGWEADVQHIIDRVDAGLITTNGHSYKWWRTVFMRAIKGNSNAAYTPAQLLGFIHTIESYALLDEYQFTPGNELQEAYDILNNHAFEEDNDGSSITLSAKLGDDQGRHDLYAFVLRELLTFELNHVTGRGFDDAQLRTIIINWGEGVLNDNTPAAFIAGPNRASIGGPMRALTSPLEGTGTITRKSNGATDGGGTGN